MHEAYAHHTFPHHLFCSRQFITGIVSGAARCEFGKGLIIPSQTSTMAVMSYKNQGWCLISIINLIQ